jgi:predicted kinase
VPATLHLLCGLPASGKSTLARQLAERDRAIRFNPDEWLHDLQVDFYDEDFRYRLEDRQWLLAQELLLLGVDVVIDWGIWVPEHREPKRVWAREHGVRVVLHVLDVPLAERWRRMELRNAAARPGTVPITYETLASYDAAFVLPDAEERARYDPDDPGA